MESLFLRTPAPTPSRPSPTPSTRNDDEYYDEASETISTSFAISMTTAFFIICCITPCIFWANYKIGQTLKEQRKKYGVENYSKKGLPGYFQSLKLFYLFVGSCGLGSYFLFGTVLLVIVTLINSNAAEILSILLFAVIFPLSCLGLSVLVLRSRQNLLKALEYDIVKEASLEAIKKFTTQEDVMDNINKYAKANTSSEINSIKSIIRDSTTSEIIIPSEQLDVNFSEAISRGGSGIVLKGKMGGTEVALKMIQSQLAGDGIQEVEGELKMLYVLNHPAIVRFYGITFYDLEGLDDVAAMLIITELCPQNLKQYIVKNGVCQNFDSFIFSLTGINDGISYLHSKKIAHCDLKPENILLDGYNNAKICDFGLAKTISNSARSRLTQGIGTPGYMPPEMIDMVPTNGNQIYDERKWDIFSLGMIYYFLWSGKHPLIEYEEGHKINEEIALGTRPALRKEMPNDLRKLVQRMWQQNFQSRPEIGKVLFEINSISTKLKSPFPDEDSHIELNPLIV